MPAHYSLERSKDKQFYYTHVAANGAIRSTSETYVSRRNVRRAVAGAKKDTGDKLPIIDNTNSP